MNPLGVLVLTCLLLILPPALGGNSTDYPPSQPTAQPPPTECSLRFCPGLTPYYPAISCRDIVLCNRFLPSGYYWVKIYHHDGKPLKPVRVYCYMKDDKCGIAGVRRLGYLDLTQSATKCPDPLTLYNVSGKRLCGPTNTDSSLCDFLTLHTHHIPYNFVCGKAVGYAYYQPTGFNHYGASINRAYLSGLSITYKCCGWRRHIWSYAAGFREYGYSSTNCPCAYNGGRSASFIGSDFYCESGTHTTPTQQWHTSNPLWDGKGCHSDSGCCKNTRMPWFWKALPEESTSDVELRLCKPGGIDKDKTGIELFELYVF